MKDVVVVIGPGQIGQAIARRVGVGKHILLADVRQENAQAAAHVMENVGYEVSVATVDVSSREAVHALVETAKGLGNITGRCLAEPGIARDDPEGRPVWHSAGAGRIRQRHGARRRGCRDRLTIRTSPPAAKR